MPTSNLALNYLVSGSQQPEVSLNANADIIDLLLTKKSGDTMFGPLKIARTAASGITPDPGLWLTPPADLLLPIVESTSVLIDGTAATRQFGSGGGTLTNQRLAVLNGATYSAAAALTITNTATLHVFGGATAGTNVTITNNAALWVQGAVCFGSNVQGTSKAGFSFAQGQSVTQPTAIYVAPVASATLTASTEAILVNFVLARTVTWAAGAIATQREFFIDRPTYAFAGASTITDTGTLVLGGAPQAGANATLTNSYALWVQSGGARIVGHLFLGGGTAPTAAAGSNAGTSPPAPVVTAGASDTRGNCTFGTGTTPAAGNQVVVTFNQAFTTAPLVLVSANNAATEALNPYAASVGTGGFTLASGNAPAASQGNTIFSFTFYCIQ